MKNLILFLTTLYLVQCQIISNSSITQVINDIFNTTVYEEVTQPPLTGFGPLRKCGEGERAGLDVCVPYYNCEPNTRTVIQTGATDGFNVIDIRFNSDDNQCDHFLDVCCQIPQNNGTTSTTSTTSRSGIVPSSTEQPFTSPTVTGGTSTSTTTRRPGGENRPDGGDGVGTTDTGGDWSTCGIRNPDGIDFKLKGKTGNEAEYGEFPWQVALLRTNYSKELHPHICICGGSLIRPNVVMTAAHCVMGFQPQQITIRAGEWDTQTTKERIPYQERLGQRIVMHEGYGDGAINDIALIYLDRAFVKVKSVGTICLPKKNQIFSSKHCFASGWGKTNFGKEGLFSVILKKIELPMVQAPECQSLLRRTRLGSRFRIHSSFICAGGEEGKDTCTGDGGSPLVCPDVNNPGRYVQTGIVSWGVGCGLRGVPGVYVDVAKFRTWIDNNLRRN